MNGHTRGGYSLTEDGSFAWNAEADWQNPLPALTDYRLDEAHPVVLVSFHDAQAFVDAGAAGLVLECVPEPVAQIITNSFDVLTIGIGAGRYCHGQFLVTQDILGLHPGISARFLKHYANLSSIIVEALSSFRADVEQERFPDKSHTYGIKYEELAQALAMLNSD